MCPFRELVALGTSSVPRRRREFGSLYTPRHALSCAERQFRPWVRFEAEPFGASYPLLQGLRETLDAPQIFYLDVSRESRCVGALEACTSGWQTTNCQASSQQGVRQRCCRRRAILSACMCSAHTSHRPITPAWCASSTATCDFAVTDESATNPDVAPAAAHAGRPTQRATLRTPSGCQ